MNSTEHKNWRANEIKTRILKMNNKSLIAIWSSIRSLNKICTSANYSNCPICGNKEYCLQSLVYEELVTEELLTRGLFDYAINVSQRNNITKLP